MLDGIVERTAVRFFAAFVIGISFGSGAASRLHHRSPAKALSWRGAIPEQQKRAGSKHSSAPVRAKYQSFLDNLVAQIARIRARNDPMGTASCCAPLIPRAAS
jgi:hypothetical protein